MAQEESDFIKRLNHPGFTSIMLSSISKDGKIYGGEQVRKLTYDEWVAAGKKLVDWLKFEGKWEKIQELAYPPKTNAAVPVGLPYDARKYAKREIAPAAWVAFNAAVETKHVADALKIINMYGTGAPLFSFSFITKNQMTRKLAVHAFEKGDKKALEGILNGKNRLKGVFIRRAAVKAVVKFRASETSAKIQRL